MALQITNYTDPATGQVYPTVYLRALPPTFDPDANGAAGQAILTVVGYASQAARAARKRELFRWSIPLARGTRQPDGSVMFDVSDIATVVGAPVGGATALPRYAATMLAVYTWLKDANNATKIGVDLSGATDAQEA